MHNFVSYLLTLSVLSHPISFEGEPTTIAIAHGPVGLNIVTRSSSMRVEDDGPDLTVTIPLDTFKTGIGLRDSHMRKMLDIDKFPDVKLMLRDEDLRQPQPSSAGSPVGRLTLHGVTKELPVRYEAECAGPKKVDVRASFEIDMTNFGIIPPSYMGISVKPNIEVSVKIRLSTP